MVHEWIEAILSTRNARHIDTLEEAITAVLRPIICPGELSTSSAHWNGLSDECAILKCLVRCSLRLNWALQALHLRLSMSYSIVGLVDFETSGLLSPFGTVLNALGLTVALSGSS
jgi:hypothetical protein